MSADPTDTDADSVDRDSAPDPATGGLDEITTRALVRTLLGLVAVVAFVVLVVHVGPRAEDGLSDRPDVDLTSLGYGLLSGFVFLGALIGVVGLRKPAA